VGTLLGDILTDNKQLFESHCIPTVGLDHKSNLKADREFLYGG
jgi:hypothetical protein